VGSSYGSYVTYGEKLVREDVVSREVFQGPAGEALTMETVRRLMREIETMTEQEMKGSALMKPKRGARAIALDGKF
jgi:hypothetical protein